MATRGLRLETSRIKPRECSQQLLTLPEMAYGAVDIHNSVVQAH